MLIGVVGKSGSGKTYFSDLLNKYDDVVVIHVDDMVHDILKDERFKYCFQKKYGEVFFSGSTIDRKKLGSYLFSSKEIMEEYNQFIWPFIELRIDDIIRNSQKPIVIDWMQLPMTKYFQTCDIKILVKASKSLRMKRVGKRDQVSNEYKEKREHFMLEYDEQVFDSVVVNEGQDLNFYVDDIMKRVSTVGFYAGSFDPFTNGHLEIIKKASRLLDRMVIGIGKNPDKERHYPEEEMKEVIQYSLKRIGIQASVIAYSGYTIDAAKECRANILIRGLRNQTDYQYEEAIATYNEEHSGIDTIYLRAGVVGNISSTLIRKKLEKGEEIQDLVPEPVYQYIMKKRLV